nr:hypothetical protein [Pandoravirus belohorizontensis]
MATTAAAVPVATPLDALVQEQLEQDRRLQSSRRTGVIAAVVLVAVLALVGIAVWLWGRRGTNGGGGNNPTNPDDCTPPCGSGTVCIDKQCKANTLACTTDAQCGACMTCVAGACTPKASCCGGVTCGAGQTCDAKTNTCVYVKGYCSADHPCGSGFVCDTAKSACIAEPPYGPGTGPHASGCVRGFGNWVATRDPATGDAVWACSCVNGSLYDPGHGCSPLADQTVCTAANLDPAALVPASKVKAFADYGWGDHPVLINPSTAGDAVPSPLGGGVCPCKSGWGGGTCTTDQSCSGNGRWTGDTTGCACFSCHNSGGEENGATYRWTGGRCDQLADCEIIINGGPASGQHFPENCSECAACTPNGSPHVRCSLGAAEAHMADVYEREHRQRTLAQLGAAPLAQSPIGPRFI